MKNRIRSVIVYDRKAKESNKEIKLKTFLALYVLREQLGAFRLERNVQNAISGYACTLYKCRC